MAPIQRKSNHLSDERRRIVLDELIQFFEKERDEEIGHLAAEQLLNFFLESVGPDIYNRGIIAAKRAVESRMDELRYDFDDLLDV